MTFMSNLTCCAEPKGNCNCERLQNNYSEYKDPPFAQYNIEKTHTLLSTSEQLVTDSGVPLYKRVLNCNSSTRTKYL